MALEGGEEPDYVSDPDDALLPSMRRREASDDEDDAAGSRGRPEPSDRRGGAESEGEGGAPYEEYDDDEDEEYEEEEYEEDDLLEEEVDEYEGKREEKGDDGEGKADEKGEGEIEKEKERVEKEVEPFVVPKAGPFYMHDDRFRDHRGFRGRRAFGGHKLWDSKDERAWMHDKFEEMNLEDTTYDQARNYRGRYRGRGKARGGGRGYGRGRKDHAYDNRYRDREGRSQGYGDRSQGYSDRSQNNGDGSRGYAEGSKIRTQKVVRGRGPRRYEPLPRNREMPTNQNKQIAEGRGPVSRSTSGNQPQQTSSQNPGSASPLKQVFTSSLNSASPPFYPGGSNPDHSVASKKDLQSVNTSKNVHASMLEDIAGPPLKGKTVGYVGHDKFLMDNAFHHVSGKNVDDSNLQWSSSALVNTNQSTQLRVPGRDFTVTGQPIYQQDLLPNKVVNGSTTQPPAMQQRPVQVHHHGVFRAQHHNADVSSPPQVQSKSSSEVDGSESASVSSKSKPAVVGKEKLSNSQSGPTPFLYGGAPIIGANGTVGIAHGTQGFAGTPALLPVMQFCGQNPGGLGVPAVGLALPGYVAQSQPGLGNSEMAWMPALASAGALGTSYGPYFAIDGGFYPRPPGQVSSTSRDGGASATQSAKPSKSPQISATANDEAGQRQNKPRRYSEMNFGQ